MSLPWAPTGSVESVAPAVAVRRRRLMAGSLLVLGLWMLGVLLVLPRTQAPAPLPARGAAQTPDAVAVERLPDARTASNAAAEAVTATAFPQPPASELTGSRLQQTLQRSSLRGSTIDGTLQLRADGRLQLDAGLVRFFEYHLALLGELELGDIRALLAEHAAQRLGAEGVRATLDAFERYLGLRQALAALPPDLSLQQKLQARMQLEREWFGDDAEAMFGEARAYDAQTVQRLDSRSGTGDDALPSTRSPQEHEARIALLAEEQTQQFETLRLSQAQRHAERTALWGADAATRLDALDAERAAWEARLHAYARDRQRLIDSGNATAGQLDALRQRDFDARERLRVEALERAGQL